MKVKGEDANERTNYCNRYYFVGLYFLTREKKPAVERVRKHRQRFFMTKTSRIIRNRKVAKFSTENTLAVNVAVDHIPFIASLVFAENA